MLSTSLAAALPWVDGQIKGNCGEEPSAACRMTWNVTGSERMTKFFEHWLDKPVSILLIIIFALVVRALVNRMIKRLVIRMLDSPTQEKLSNRTSTIFHGSPLLTNERRRQRIETVGSILRHIASMLILITATVTVLDKFEINLAPVLASATVIGMAVGFGAQNVVRDFLAGTFMLLEDQYGVGDVITIGDTSGSVEAVTLRTTRMRDTNGVVWYIRNGEISKVGNESQGWARAVLDVPVSYGEDIDRVRALLAETAQTLASEPPWAALILEEPSVWGVQALSGEAVVVRVVTKTAPLKQWEVARELRERVKEAFDEAGITVATFKEDTSAA